MPCCIAIIQYPRCQHSMLFKIGCTAHCDDLCPVSEQRTLLITRSLWSCEECHLRLWSAESDLRSKAWNTRTEELALSTASAPSETREELLSNLQSREQHEYKLLEHSRIAQLEEIQWVAEWTCQYGLGIWEILYRRADDPAWATQRIEELRGMRLWDFVVTRDALRNEKELFHQQRRKSAWIGQGGNCLISPQHDVTDEKNVGYRRSRRKAAPSPDGPPQKLPPLPGHSAEITPVGEEESQKHPDQQEADMGDDSKHVMAGLSLHSSHPDSDAGWGEEPLIQHHLAECEEE